MEKNVSVMAVITAIMLLGFGALYFANSSDTYTGKMESIVVAWSPFEHSALLYIAEDQHFFSQNGLNVTSRKYDVPAASLDGMRKGEVDIVVGAAEWPLVRRAFENQRIRTIGNIDKSELVYLVGRKDRGIEKVTDLKGKKVGIPSGTVGEFYLGRFLDLHGMNMQDLTIVDVKTPAEQVNAVVNGDVDAVVNGQPYVNSIKERLGANAVVLPVQSNQPLYALIISTDEWMTKHPELVKRFLKSLSQAEAYAIHNPAEAKAIVQKRLNLDAAYMETVWSQNQFTLSLDQSLILAMEDEARWMIKNNLTTEKNMPNFLDYIYEDAIRAIKPDAVNIIR